MLRVLKIQCFLCVFFIFQISASGSVFASGKITAVADEIRHEAALSNNSESGFPLPLAAHWNTGSRMGGFSPVYQMLMIEQGHYLLPWFSLPSPWSTESVSNNGYYEKAIKKAAELRLPISFISTQWESPLTDSMKYFFLPGPENPNFVDTKGVIHKKVSPFGPEPLWREVGEKWTTSEIVRKFQEWYPDPPLVLFVSNNEHGKLVWHEVENSSKYMAKYGSGRDDNFKRKVVGDEWVKRYRELQGGMRAGLIAPGWSEHSKFIGYEAFGTRAFGRWTDWLQYSLFSPGRIEPWPLAWDGASLSYYVDNWSPVTDHTVMSPQIEAMNWVFMRDEAWHLNKDFWVEMSTWDGHLPGTADDKREYYRKNGTKFSPERYEGYVQFGMWLLRPRIVREFRDHLSKVTKDEPYFMSVVNSVDRVHDNPVLRKFWRKGSLVENKNNLHPYQINIPNEYKTVGRWFLLDTDLDPKRPWDLNTNIPVYSLALVLGDKPNREWLLYAQSPLKNFNNVKITITDYAPVNITVSPHGVFYYVKEKNSVVTKLAD